MLKRWFCLTAVAVGAYGVADFSFAIIGDRNGGYVGGGVYAEIAADVNAYDPAFVITVGDQIDGKGGGVDALNAEWDEYFTEATFEAPFYAIPGNHDIRDDVSAAVWEKRTGHPPCYSFDYEGVHVAVVDTSRWDYEKDWLEKSGYGEWLEKDLAAHKDDRLTLVFYHKPYWYDVLADGEADAFHELFIKNGVDAVFNGHYHVNGTGAFDGVTYTIVGSSGGGINDEDPNRGVFFQYMICDVTGDSLTARLYRKGEKEPTAQVTVGDHKLLDKIEVEGIRVAPAAVGDRAAGAVTGFSLTLRNYGDAPLTTTPAWESGENWTVTPSNTTITVPAGDAATVAFDAKLNSAFYPLPVLKLDYPYREGRVMNWEGKLPALRQQPITPLAAAPIINGVLDDGCWVGAATATYFCDAEGNPASVEPTTFRFGYDSDNLYVAAECTHADTSTIKAVCAATDDATLARDDCVGFFLCPALGDGVFYQIYVNAAAVVYDVKYAFAPPFDLQTDGPEAWNSGGTYVTATDDDKWVLEGAIPFSALGVDSPKPGEQWRVNFRRKEIVIGGSADWQYPIAFDPRTFGFLMFE